MEKMTKGRAKKPRQLTAPQAAGWRIGEYFPHLVGFGGESTYHALPDEARPHHIRVGRSVIITETPAAYLARLAKISARRPIQLKPANAGAARRPAV